MKYTNKQTMFRSLAVVGTILLLLVALLSTATAQTGGTFNPTGSLVTTVRTVHTATRLPSGQVLVAGGFGPVGSSSGDGLSSAELFDPVSGTWSPTGNMNFRRFGHTAVQLPNGKVLIIGGTSTNVCTGAPVGNSAEIFDPMTGTWNLTSNMNVPRNVPAAVLLSNGKVLVAGGGNRCGGVFSSAEIYDPATETWTLTGNMNVARQEPASVLLPDGKVLVAGGSGGFPFPSLASAEIYDPATETWTLTGNMNEPRIWTSDDWSSTGDLVLLSTGKILTVGGYHRFCSIGTCSPTIYLNSAELFDPDSETWIPTDSMGSARSAHGTTLLPTGEVLVTGGHIGTTNLDTADLFDPASGIFTPVGNMTVARGGHSATLLSDGRVLLAGGGDGTKVLDSAEIFSANNPPTVNAGGPYDVNEGDSVTVTAFGSDPDSDPLTFAWDLDNDGTFETPGQSTTFSAVGLDGPGAHTITVQVTDNGGLSATDHTTVDVINVAPTVDAGPDQTVFRNDIVTVSGTWTDPAGSLDNPYGWSWDLDGDGSYDSSGTVSFGETIVDTTSFPLAGQYTLTFQVADKDEGVGSDSLLVEVLNQSPDCSAALPSLDILWPPNHQFVPISILGVTDPEADPISITIDNIFQDEPVDAEGDGKFTPDGQGIGTSMAEVRAERIGTKKEPGNGRVYLIGFTADDGHGGACSGEVLVGVPHDEASVPVDEGALYDSTAP